MKLVYKIRSLTVVAAMVVLAFLLVWGTLGSSTTAALMEVKDGFAPAMLTSQKLEESMTSIQRVMQDAVAAEDLEALDAIGPLEQSFLGALEQARQNPMVPAARVDKVAREFRDYLALARDTSAGMIRRDQPAALRLEEVSSRYSSLAAELSEAASNDRARLGASLERALEYQNRTGRALLILILISAGAIGALTVWTQRALRPLRDLTAAASAISAGDLAQNLTVTSNDEIGQLAAAFTEMLARLRVVHAGIQGSVARLASAASQIQASAQEQEAGTAQQASAVEEVSRTMQGLLESATHISNSAQGVLANAERTKETSELMATRIAELSGQTSRMNEILEAIREIADRSDLLALNASLEGTRAGEAGKGFSLVATEMRRLAERIAASVGDVKALLTEVRASSSATVLVTEESRKLAESTTASARQITLVTQQQRTATEQVSRNMCDAANVLSQSVASIGQVRSAAENLKGEADALTGIATGFRVEGPGGRG